MSKPSIGSQSNPIDNLYVKHLHTEEDIAPVGSLLLFTSNGTIPNGYLECDGSAVSRAIYPDLFAVIGTTYGSGDGSTTFNLPNYSDGKFMEGRGTAGTVKNAGLPNIKGHINNASRLNTPYSGALHPVKEGSSSWSGTTVPETYGMSFNASLSNPIYSDSVTTVQPYSCTVRVLIKAFNGQTTDSALIDITQYAQELAHKANINGSNMVHHKDVITTSGTYTVPATGLYKITAKGGGGGGGKGGSKTNGGVGGDGGGEGGTTIAYVSMTAGDTATVVIGAGGTHATTSTAPAGDGGDTSVTYKGNTYTGGGGGGGISHISNQPARSFGGSGTIPGCSGCSGSYEYNAGAGRGGTGGGTGGATGGNNASDTYQVATPVANSGGGGGGGSYATVVGSDGADGFVWFEYFANI